ncbi:hypothetical protein EDL99_07940 [Ornithobacterium rhinotracheale]|uniref:DUF5683 domain-containing protein n=1 Tax=Ornithobacterium rhinotracheale TaxID=28251 RepID=UPI00129C2C67|nr:DUF5683 domain-containing protein [Ornithobacterium rhinotracheale]MRJ08793.1 hypothetical protein [Ornithobacterium rhinotracheale]UOH77063.1 DUF5683 domain-containing protein [Ornithobacterium rhinotracheale]
MKIKFSIISFFLMFSVFAQITDNKEIVQDSIYISQPLDSVQVFKKNPMKAALYSAVLPGLGQIYNKRYWKAPIVWGLIGTGVGITLWYQKSYHEYRDAYIAELNGKPNKYHGIYTKEVLAQAQDYQKRNRDYAIALTIVAYAVNILDATVDAHLYEVRKDKDLKIKPVTIYSPSTNELKPGLALSFTLK